MDDQEFDQLLDRVEEGETELVLAAVDAEPGLATRGSGGQDWADGSFSSWFRGLTLLHRAACDDNVDLASGLLDRGADLHAKDTVAEYGWVALMYACYSGRVPVATLLLDRGADVNATSNQGQTALFIAAEMDKIEAALLLISRSADLMAQDDQGLTALDVYGENKSIGDEIKEERPAELRTAFAAGPHPSQVQRRRDENWARRAAFVRVLAESDLQPLAARRAELAVLHPPLPPDAAIPRLPCETPAQRRALLRDKVLSHPGIVKHVAAFL
jgi:ankyrin repeat protein